MREGTLSAPVPEAHEGVGVAAQWLFCPMLDDRTALDRTRDAEDHFIWSNRSNLVGWRSYLGAAFGTDDVPRYAVAARREDLSGLPPAWLYTSDVECSTMRTSRTRNDCGPRAWTPRLM